MKKIFLLLFFPAIISGQDVLQDGYPDSVIMIIKSSELEIDSFGVGGHTVTLNYYNNNNFTGYAIIESETNLRDFGYIRKPINKKLVENDQLIFIDGILYGYRSFNNDGSLKEDYINLLYLYDAFNFENIRKIKEISKYFGGFTGYQLREFYKTDTIKYIGYFFNPLQDDVTWDEEIPKRLFKAGIHSWFSEKGHLLKEIKYLNAEFYFYENPKADSDYEYYLWLGFNEEFILFERTYSGNLSNNIEFENDNTYLKDLMLSDTTTYFEDIISFDGFFITSLYKLTKKELLSFINHYNLNLKVIRNEIFARHGYIFKNGGEMDKYFSSKEWYIPKLNNINHLLSDIEKHNIRLIKQLEK